LVGHAFLKSVLFLIAGVLLHRFSTVDIVALQGYGREIPWLGALFLICACGLTGLPPWSTLCGEHWIQAAAHQVGYEWTHWISMIAAIGTGAALFKVYGRVFQGWGPKADVPIAHPIQERPETKRPGYFTPLGMILSMLALVVCGVAAGVATMAFSPTDKRDILEALGGTGAAVGLACLGLFPEVFRVQKGTSLRRFTDRASKALIGLHTAYIGDYLLWLLGGVGLYGLALLTSLLH
jgi:multicomponent Na+:H+ antiporter subunit D